MLKKIEQHLQAPRAGDGIAVSAALSSQRQCLVESLKHRIGEFGRA